jgi:FkbM family methyltransferase
MSINEAPETAEATSTRTVRKGTLSFDVVGGQGAVNDAFWDWFGSAEWEPDTVAVFERFLLPTATYVDLGAWIGPTVFLAAHKVGRVVCFEPDSAARAELVQNLTLNPEIAARVVVHDQAVAAHDGVVHLHSPSIGGDSLSSVFRRNGDLNSWEVPAIGIATFVATEEGMGTDFFKIDVEGSEYRIVPALAAYISAERPSIYLALHPNFVYDKTSIRSRLTSAIRLVRLNRTMLRTLAGYKHHYVWDERRGDFRNIRMRNLIRIALPLPIRAAILSGSCLFTNTTA